MKKFLTVASFAMVAVLSYAQDNEAASDQPEKVWYDQELFLQNVRSQSDNPVSIAYNPYSQLNDFKVSYSHENGSFKPIEGATTGKLLDVNIYGAKKVNKVSFEGSMYYGVHDLFDARWNSTVLLSENNPFIIADTLTYNMKGSNSVIPDSIPNNQSREVFDLRGGFAWQVSDKFTVGLRAIYIVGTKYDQSDPRFESHGARVSINPGAQYSLSDRISLGLSLTAAVYHENCGMSVKDNLYPNHEDVFLFQELGGYVIEQAGRRRYDGNTLGGSLQFTFAGDRLQNQLEAGYRMVKENVDDGNLSFTKHGGDWSENTMSFTDRLQFASGNVIHNVILSGAMTNNSCLWYKQQARNGQFGEDLYDVISTEIVQKQKNLSATLSYRFDYLKENRPSISASLSGGIDKVKITQYPDEYHVWYTLANAGLDLTKYLHFRKTDFQVKAYGKYVMDLSKLDISLPTATGKQKVMRGYFIPKYQYLSAGYIKAGICADAVYRINRKSGTPCYVKLGGSFDLADYSGDYSRFKNRTACDIHTSLTF